jgi:hypothetical protein
MMLQPPAHSPAKRAASPSRLIVRQLVSSEEVMAVLVGLLCSAEYVTSIAPADEDTADEREGTSATVKLGLVYDADAAGEAPPSLKAVLKWDCKRLPHAKA